MLLTDFYISLINHKEGKQGNKHTEGKAWPI